VVGGCIRTLRRRADYALDDLQSTVAQMERCFEVLRQKAPAEAIGTIIIGNIASGGIEHLTTADVKKGTLGGAWADFHSD
jgi:hypothetical protein